MKPKKLYEDYAPEIKALLEDHLNSIKRDYSSFGLSDEELERIYKMTLTYFKETINEGINIVTDWTRVILEREILIYTLATRSREALEEIVRRMELDNVSPN